MTPADLPGPGAQDAATLDVLAPERTCQVAGRTLTVRELTLRDALTFHARLGPVIDALLPAYGHDGAGVGTDDVLCALAAHPDLACDLLAATTGESADWFAALPERDGMLALLTFIAVHVPFFATRLELGHQAATRPAWPKPSPGSSGTDTGPRH